MFLTFFLRLQVWLAFRQDNRLQDEFDTSISDSGIDVSSPKRCEIQLECFCSLRRNQELFLGVSGTACVIFPKRPSPRQMSTRFAAYSIRNWVRPRLPPEKEFGRNVGLLIVVAHHTRFCLPWPFGHSVVPSDEIEQLAKNRRLRSTPVAGQQVICDVRNTRCGASFSVFLSLMSPCFAWIVLEAKRITEMVLLGCAGNGESGFVSRTAFNAACQDRYPRNRSDRWVGDSRYAASRKLNRNAALLICADCGISFTISRAPSCQRSNTVSSSQ